ncbi:hypothetical protein LTR17_009722 [Elasticomyces elasticus]|nr:hypothetical protein LTR17_009722 [Elasticomyces elasticus]
MALTNLDPKIVGKLFLAKMVKYVHSGELNKDYDEAKKAEEKFGRMRAQQVFVTKDGISPCEDIAEVTTTIAEAHQEELQKPTPGIKATAQSTDSQPPTQQPEEKTTPFTSLPNHGIFPNQDPFKISIDRILNGPKADLFRSHAAAYQKRLAFTERSAMTMTFAFWGSPGGGFGKWSDELRGYDW